MRLLTGRFNNDNMKGIFLFFFLLAYTSVSSQITEAIKLSSNIFHEATVKAGIFHMDFPPEIKLLQDKAITNLNKYPEWKGRGIIYMIKEGDQYIKFMDEMGLTKEEFTAMYKGLMKGKQRVVTDTIDLRIKITNNVISFSSKGKLNIINPLTINLSSKKIKYDCWASTKEFYRTNGIVYVPGFEGSEVHFEKLNIPQKAKYNLVGLGIGKSLSDKKAIISFMFTDENYESGKKPTQISIVIF